MSKIKKAENQVKFPELEDKINQFWKENKIFEKSVEYRSPDLPYVFVDGPPFVSGSPHYGHLLASIAKDVVPRYQTMKGKRVRRVFGWDCHGLAVENKVNQKLGIKSSKQLEEEFGIEEYIKECRNYIQSTSNDWRWYIEKIGRWVDMDNAYYTMSPEYTESVMWAFKQIWEKGHVYKGKRVSLFSTDTSTPVSNFEVAMDADNYRDVEDLSVFVKFEITDLIKDRIPGGYFEMEDGKVKPTYLVAWTTTPWTLPANFALAVNPKEDYLLVEFEGERFIVAKARAPYTFNTTEEHIGGTPDKLVHVLAEFKGSALEGLNYKPVYNYFVADKKDADFKVYLYEGVTIEDGTGVLHVAPAFGEEDFNLGKKFELSDTRDIDEAGNMTVEPWVGVYLRDASPLIAEDMAKKGSLLRSEAYVHRLPFYRGDNPLIYMAQDSYFVNIQDQKDKLLENAKEINWVPSYIKDGRWQQTIEGSPDWAISRNRYWASVMPIWKSEDGKELVIGSFEELMQYTDQIEKRDNDGKAEYYLKSNGERLSAHRDKMDQIVLKKDGKEYRRIPEVLDCWMDSGSAPFAEYHYPFENKQTFEKAFPADFIIEYVGQVRAWFNVLHRISNMIFDNRSFTNVICTGVLAGNDGRKMSKTYGNYPDPKEVLNNIGAEALRLYMMSSPIMVGGDMNWSDELLNEQVKNVLIPLWNTYKYLTIYADLHDWTPETSEFKSNNVLDKWLESFVKKTVLDYQNALESYNIPESVKLIQPAIDNVSSWWIRRSRDRFAEGDVEALQNLYAALVMLIKTFAPQMAFVTEEMYQNLVRDVLPNAKESVHLDDFPVVDEKEIDFNLLKNMEDVRAACSVGNSIRVEKALKVRQPLSDAYINVAHLDKELLEIVADELNVKEVNFFEASTADHESKKDKELSSNTKYSRKESNYTVVYLNIELTPELREEGLYAELKRQIQNLRKTSGLQMGEIAKLQLVAGSNKDFVSKVSDKLKKDTGLSEVELVETLDGEKIKFDDTELTAKLIK